MNAPIIEFYEAGHNAVDQVLPPVPYCQRLILDMVIRHTLCIAKGGEWVKDADVKAFKDEHNLHNYTWTWE